jgi:uncharacterized protein YndB with AHSA1/START domain
VTERNNPAAMPENAFVITRTFDAPRDLVWAAYTQSEHLAHWWGPKGFKMLECKIDLRPGGIFHYGMQAPDGSTMWGKWIFREIVKPERLVVVISFSDQAGGVTRHPFAPSWPLQTLSVATLTEHAGKTTITLQWTALDATELERQTFDASHDSMRAGFTGTFDQLTAYLATLRATQSTPDVRRP